MKTIKVAAAIIKKNNKIFATRRGYGEFAGFWEFPGGKVEPGETARQALVREIKEELDAKIKVGELFWVVEYDYPQFHLSMDCYFCELVGDKMTLLEHSAGKWLAGDELFRVDWLPADQGLIERLKTYMSEAANEKE